MDRMIRIFVRIGALRRFHLLKERTAGMPVKVEWDRRRRDSGPTAAEEKRSQPPFTWQAADFVVVEEPAADMKNSDRT